MKTSQTSRLPAPAVEPAKAVKATAQARVAGPVPPQADLEYRLRRAALLGHRMLEQGGPPPPVAPSRASTGILQRVTGQAVEQALAPGRIQVFRNLVIFQMFQEKKATPEELLADYSLSEMTESVAVWAQGRNATVLARYAFLLGKAAAERKLAQLQLSLSQLDEVDRRLTLLGKAAEAADFILLAAVKGLDSAALLQMIATNVAVEQRGYPYPFASAGEFTTFKQGVTGLVAAWNLPVDDIRVQGSALRKTNPGDVDLATMVDDQTFAGLGERMIAGTAMDKIKKDIQREMKKGKISGFNFDRLGGGASFTTQLVELMPRLDEHHIQPTLAIILRGSSMDLSPFMRF